MQRENYKAMSVKQEAVDDFMEYIATYFEKTGEFPKIRSVAKIAKADSPSVSLPQSTARSADLGTRRDSKVCLLFLREDVTECSLRQYRVCDLVLIVSLLHRGSRRCIMAWQLLTCYQDTQEPSMGRLRLHIVVASEESLRILGVGMD